MVNEYKNKIIHGNCLNVLKRLSSNSVDSVVTDPPYGLSKEPDIREVLTKWINGEPYDHGHKGFMGKSWDSFVPHPDIWKEVYRVLKPGGHALVFAGTRTQDLMTIALRLAGFEIRDVIQHIFFSGFPKSHDVSKAFDRRAGVEGEVIGERRFGKTSTGQGSGWNVNHAAQEGKQDVTAPATELARKWDGWGTALKPAHEPIIVVRKPLQDGKKLTVADCVERYGTGAINIDASRIGDDEITIKGGGSKVYDGCKNYFPSEEINEQRIGRFPANCITLDSDEFYSKYFNISPPELSKKASKKDRNSDWQGNEIKLEVRPAGGLQGRADGSLGKKTFNRNTHTTVKPTELMAWLVRLITPQTGVVLDPFAGSGSTLVAAKREGFDYIGIEMTPEYVEIAKARTGEAI